MSMCVVINGVAIGKWLAVSIVLNGGGNVAAVLCCGGVIAWPCRNVA